MPTRGERSTDLEGLTGLSEAEAQRRLGTQGPNELSAQKKRSLLAIVLEIVREPMFIMLIVAGSLYLLLSIGAGLACTLWFEALKLGKRWAAARRAAGTPTAVRPAPAG